MFGQLLTLLLGTIIGAAWPIDYQPALDQEFVVEVAEADNFSSLSGGFISPSDSNEKTTLKISRNNPKDVADPETKPARELAVKNETNKNDLLEKKQTIKETVEIHPKEIISPPPVPRQPVENMRLPESITTPIPSAPHLIEGIVSFAQAVDLSSPEEIKKYSHLGQDTAKQTAERLDDFLLRLRRDF